MAGYSGTPLPQKLGIKPSHRVGLIDAPADLELPGVSGQPPFDVMVAFFTERQALQAAFEGLARQLKSNGGLWIAWPKKASGLPTTLNENVIRDIGLSAGLVDNKVCAISDVWSGLRFVYRLKDRPKP